MNKRPQSSKRLEQLFTAGMASIGIAIYIGDPLTSAPPLAVQYPPSNDHPHNTTLLNKPYGSEQGKGYLISHISEATPTISAGTYVYGQSSVPFSIGHEYLVFEVNGAEITGVAYYPHSEFVCFTGTLEEHYINAHSFDHGENTLPDTSGSSTSRPIILATIDLSPANDFEPTTVTQTPINLADYHAISSMSELDQQLLEHCQENESVLMQRLPIDNT